MSLATKLAEVIVFPLLHAGFYVDPIPRDTLSATKEFCIPLSCPTLYSMPHSTTSVALECNLCMRLICPAATSSLPSETKWLEFMHHHAENLSFNHAWRSSRLLIPPWSAIEIVSQSFLELSSSSNNLQLSTVDQLASCSLQSHIRIGKLAGVA